MQISVDLHRAEVRIRKNGGPPWVRTGFTYTELRLLSRLTEGGVVSRGALLMSAWSGKTIKWDQANPSRRVDVAVARLRSKLSKFGINITAVPGEGYRI